MTLAEMVAQYGEADVTRWAERWRRIETEMPCKAVRRVERRLVGG